MIKKFCNKCGTKLDEKTGKCPICDKNFINKKDNSNINTNNNQQSQPKSSKKEKKAKSGDKTKKSKKGLITIITILVLIFAILTSIFILAYNDTIDIPFVNDILVSMGIKEDNNDASNEKDKNIDSNLSGTTSELDDYDLSIPYEVPEFDAEKYFRENTTLKEIINVSDSSTICSESDAYAHFTERGFNNVAIVYDYNIDGSFLDEKVASNYSNVMHPMYYAYYTTTAGDLWLINEVNGAFFAVPYGYNYSNEAGKTIIFSESDTITSYDNATNKFYVNIPKNDDCRIIKVESINVDVIEKLTSEEIDKL